MVAPIMLKKSHPLYNVDDVLNGRAESAIKISEVRRVLAVMEAAWKSAQTNEAVLFE